MMRYRSILIIASRAANSHRFVSTIRNVGVVAHIDAGKTTTSEQMLFLCGETKQVGRVDSGDTVMDFLPQERERGITISSAAVSFQWKKHDINLIDTPGHVDFTVEVERSARVLDGAIVIVDAVSGVQSQTRTVWKQTRKQNIPAIAFINKMDRDGASFDYAIESIKKKLNANPIPIQYPLGSESSFHGVIDLISMSKVLWDSSPSTSRTPKRAVIEVLNKDDDIYSDVLAARRRMIDGVAELDEIIMNKYLEDTSDDLTSISENEIIEAIRRCTLQGSMIPAICGASLKGKGVEPILDSIIAFLPSPQDRPASLALNKGTNTKKPVTFDSKDFCALAFKVVYHQSRGPMVYIRVYSGHLNNKQVIHNSNRNSKERVNQLLAISASDFTNIETIHSGQVGCLVGLKDTKTGDTLVIEKGPLQNYILDGLNIPKSVYSLAIEPEKASQQTELEEALSKLTLEDPSLHVEIDKESGQTMLKGIGELHLEIVIDKLKRQYGIEVSIGKAYIAYRESIGSSSDKISKYFVYDRVSSNKRMFAAIEIQVTPTGLNEECMVTINEALKKSLNGEEYTSLVEGFASALGRGLLGYPIVGLNITVSKLDKDQDTTAGSIRACASMIVSSVLKESDYHELLEPYMLLEIELPGAYVGDVLSDITVKRRGHIKDVSTKDSINVINADVPLCKMLGYATTIRSLTQGEAVFSMEYINHRPVDLVTAKSDISN